MFHISSNFSYKSTDWLDARQGQAKTKSDLLHWDIPVPEGFMGCLDGIWYYYDSLKSDPETGHWVPYVVGNINEVTPEEDLKRAVAVGVIRGLNNDVIVLKKQTKLMDNVLFPVQIVSAKADTTYNSSQEDQLEEDSALILPIIQNLITSGQYKEEYDINDDGIINTDDRDAWANLFNNCRNSYTYLSAGTGSTYWLEVGSFIRPKVTWNVKKQGSSAVPEIETSIVSGPTNGVIDGFTWTSKTGLSNNSVATYKYNITSIVDEDIWAEASVSYKFGYKTYTGTGNEAFGEKLWYTMTDLADFDSTFVENGKMSAKTFDCSGGKYPYILIPKIYYSPSNKTYVNDNLMSDFKVVGVNPGEIVQVKNNRGVNIPYVLLRTTYIQTGSAIKIDIR